MILNIIKAEYIKDYQLKLDFDNGKTVIVDLKHIIFNDHRKIFEPLRDISYFIDFKIKFNTITWKNEADFAPEFLFELGQYNTK